MNGNLHRAIACLAVMFWAALASQAVAQDVPQAWLDAWRQPTLADRPLQIVHGVPPQRASVEGMRYYKDLGLGGVVCNVAFKDYMRSEESWQVLQRAAAACAELGLVVWIYDEDGYPSGAAGGLVLEKDRAFEATELAFDPSANDPFVIRTAYEHTHASNNCYAARRYANLIDDRAMRCFREVTHDTYWKRLEPYFGSTIQATFTDEPSLITVNLGRITESIRRNVRVVDPVDPAVRPLPAVPWCYDLAEQYQKRYGQELKPHFRSLFEGDSEEDRRVRRQYWELIAELIADRYFGPIQRWCQAHRVASSGHTLHEESLIHQVPMEGDALKVLSRMDIPGLDMLNSEPTAVMHSGWLTAGLPSSAALLNGRRRVMTEVSDFSQRVGGQGAADLGQMQATAAWQAAWGVTDFTLYYSIGARPPEVHRAYCDYVGRLNAVLKPAKIERSVLLYYPVWDLWTEYRPVAEPMRLDSQSPRARRIVESFMRIGRLLQRSQVPFALIDHELLAAATTGPDGCLALGDGSFSTLLIPDGAELPDAAAKVVERFRAAGGRVLSDGPDVPLDTKARILELVNPARRIEPASDALTLGAFQRDGREVLLVVNTAKEAYEGRLAPGEDGAWIAMNPADGSVAPVQLDDAKRLPLRLDGRSAVLLVRAAKGEKP